MSATDDALWAAMDAYLDSDPSDAEVSRERMSAAIDSALPHLTSATPENLDRLRNTPVGRALMAESWDEGARATNRAWEHAYDGHPVDPDFPYYECQTCDVANPYPEEIE